MMTQRGFATCAWLGLAVAGVTGVLAQEPAKEPLKTLKNSIGLQLVLIPAGEFDIGTPDGTKFNTSPSEKPQHRVKITKAFYLGKFEVTQEQYEKVMGQNPSFFCNTRHFPFKARLYSDVIFERNKSQLYVEVIFENFKKQRELVKDLDTSQFPVEDVTWDNAQAFCAKLSNLEEEKKAGRVYRLPTSAEWEYACRAGTTTLFYVGDTTSFKHGNFGFGAGGMFGGRATEAEAKMILGRTTKVGSYPPNPWGLHDFFGNVSEWCQDYFDPDYYKLKVKEDPQGPKVGYSFTQPRVMRGGAWSLRDHYMRSASRFPSGQLNGPGRLGFRVVCVSAAGDP
jgi:formylglycine-generating enzyme required for sulfatase activity